MARARFETDLVSDMQRPRVSLPDIEPKNWRSTSSDPQRFESDLSNASAGARMKRSNTVSDGSVPSTVLHRRVFELTPQKRVELHQLHEKQLRQRNLVQRCMSNFSNSQRLPLDVWRGAPGSWTVRGSLCLENPTDEPPYHVRSFDLIPRSLFLSARSVLWMCGIGVVNTKGAKSDVDTLPGQDNFSVTRLQNGWEMFMITDGHGVNGQWPATKALEVLPSVLQGEGCTKMLQNAEVEAALILAFERTQQFLEEESPKAGVMLELAGCTVVCAVRHPNIDNTLWVATVGDSRAVLVSAGEGVIERTSDQKPTVAEERKRIEESGGEIITDVIEGQETKRVFVLGEAYPGLAMTRSLGDTIVKDCGVICEPEVVEWHVDSSKGLTLVAATDGLWDFLDSDVVASHVSGGLAQGKKTQTIAEDLLSLSRSAWHEATDGEYIDDITILVVPLNGPSTTRPFSFAFGCQCFDGLSRLIGRNKGDAS